MRDVGEIGESVLAQWAAQVGITANRVQRDRTGWDFLLELPYGYHEGPAHVPLDRKVGPVQCLVQVKSTDSQPRRWAIKLDNWMRLVQSPLPAFVLVLEFEGSNECKGAYLVHVGDAVIRRVLQRVRELSVSSPELLLHTKTHALRYGKEDALNSRDGAGLLQGIVSHVGAMVPYVAGKQKTVKSIGYEVGGQFIQAQLCLPEIDSGASPDERLVDWSLGLVTGAKIAPGAKVYDERFGIRSPHPVHRIPTWGTIVPGPIGPGLLSFRTLDGHRETTFKVDIYGSADVSGYVSADKHKVRIAAPFGDIFIPFSDPTALTIELCVPQADDCIPLSDLRPLADFVLLSDSTTSPGPLEMELQSDGPPFSVTIDSISHDVELVKLSQAIRYAWRVTRELGLPRDLDTTVDEIYCQFRELQVMEGVLRGEASDSRVIFWTDDRIDLNEVLCFPVFMDVQICARILVLGIAFIGTPSPTGSQPEQHHEFALTVSHVMVSYREASPPNGVPSLSREDILERVAQEHANLKVIRWWNSISPDEDQ